MESLLFDDDNTEVLLNKILEVISQNSINTQEKRLILLEILNQNGLIT